MPYRFATKKEDYSDFASGRVFYNIPGHPAFAIRLMSEIFQRCMAIRKGIGLIDPANLYDPCCGAAYHLAVLGYLHGNEIATLVGSDVDHEVLTYAGQNLGLLTEKGLEKREEEIENMVLQFGKESHKSALKTIERFKAILGEMSLPIQTHLFHADATQSQEIDSNMPYYPIDIVFADVPYDQHTAWKLPDPLLSSPQTPVWRMLEALTPIMVAETVIAIAANKAQEITHESYRRIERFQIGKRQVVLLQLSKL